MDKHQEERRVTRAIKRALALIAEHDPELARLLSESIKTGEYLLYSPRSQSASRRRSQLATKTPLQQAKNPSRPGQK
jgi:hypothetical protein